MYEKTENFLLECVAREQNRTVDIFDELRYSKQYYSYNFKLDFEKFPCTSSSIRVHNQKAYHQHRLWLVGPTKKICDLDPELYAYQVNDDGLQTVTKLLTIFQLLANAVNKQEILYASVE